MKPVIVYPRGNPSEAFLIDADKVVTVGENRMGYCLAAVALGEFREGQVIVLDDDAGIALPRPCILRELKKDGWAQASIRPGKDRPEPFAPAHRGIFPDAAAVMLKLAEANMPAEIRRDRVTIGESDEDWCEWKFLAAWRWSLWQSTYLNSGKKRGSLSDRHQDLIDFGYGGTFDAFKMMLSRMGLKMTTSRMSGR